MAAEEAPANRLPRELYEMTGGGATTMVRGEELARSMSVDPDDENDGVRFLGAVQRLEEEATS